MELQDFGVPEDVERAYYDLRDHGPASPRALQVWLPRRVDASTVLEQLKVFGMAAQIGDGRWLAEDWKVAVERVSERFIEQQQHRAREVMAAEQPSTASTSMVQELVGIDEINNGYLWPGMANAQESVCAFDLPPYLNPREDPAKINDEGLTEIAAEWEPLKRGVEIRGIYDPSAFRNNPTKVREISEFVAQGEQSRWFPVNQKLIIIDRREVLIGQLETYSGPPEEVRALRTDHPVLVAHFNALWDETWAKAFPWKPPPGESADPDDKTEFAYQCILAGATDSASLARMMGLSDRQARRYFVDVMDELGAANQVELGKIIQSTLDNFAPSIV